MSYLPPSLLKTSLIYTALSFLQPLASFLLLPLYLAYFTPEEYGVFSLLNNCTIFFSLVGGLGIGVAVNSYFYHYQKNEEQLHAYVGNILAFSVYLNIAIFVLLLFSGDVLFSLIFSSSVFSFYPLGLLAVITGLCSTISVPYLTVLRCQKDVRRFSIITLLIVLLTIVLQLLFVIGFQWGIEGALSARAVGAFSGAVAALWLNMRIIPFRLNRELLKGSLRFSFGSFPASLLGWGASVIDRFIIERLAGLTVLGAFSLLTTLTSLLEMVFWAVLRAVQPELFDAFQKGQKENKEKILRLCHFYFAISLLAFSGIVLLGCNINLLTTKEGYITIIPLVVFSAFGFFLSSVQNLMVQHIYFGKRSSYLLYLSFCGFLLAFCLNFFFVSWYGLVGAVVAGVAVRFLMLFISFFTAQKAYRVDVGWKKLFTKVFLLSAVPPLIISFSLLINFNIHLASLIQFIVMVLLLLTSLKLEKWAAKPRGKV